MARARTEIEVAGVRITSPERVLYEGQGITKRELAEYHAAVADRLLPHAEAAAGDADPLPAGSGEGVLRPAAGGPGVPASVRRVEVEEEGEVAAYLEVGSLPGAALAGAARDAGAAHLVRPHATGWTGRTGWCSTWTPRRSCPSPPWWRRRRSCAGGCGSWGWSASSRRRAARGCTWSAPLVRRSTFDEVREFARGAGGGDGAARARALPGRGVQVGARRADLRGLPAERLGGERGGGLLAARPAGRPRLHAAGVGGADHGSLDPRAFTIRTVPERLRSLKREPWSEYGRVSQSLTAGVRRALGV